MAQVCCLTVCVHALLCPLQLLNSFLDQHLVCTVVGSAGKTPSYLEGPSGQLDQKRYGRLEKQVCRGHLVLSVIGQFIAVCALCALCAWARRLSWSKDSWALLLLREPEFVLLGFVTTALAGVFTPGLLPYLAVFIAGIHWESTDSVLSVLGLHSRFS